MFAPLLRVIPFLLAFVVTATAAERTGTALNLKKESGELMKRVLYAEEPVYPVSSRYAKHEGSGIFWIHVTQNGRVNAVKIVESTKYKDLDNAAVYALYRWRFKSGPVAQALIPITFSLLNRSIGIHHY